MAKIKGWKKENIKDIKDMWLWDIWENRFYNGMEVWITRSPATMLFYVDCLTEIYPKEWERKEIGKFKTRKEAYKCAINWMKKHPRG